MGLMQGLQTGFNKLGKAAGQAIDETRIQVELMGARRRKDAAARDLGYLVYRVTQGATTLPGEQDAIVKRIADIEKQIEKLDGELKQLRVGKGPPPAAGGIRPPARAASASGGAAATAAAASGGIAVAHSRNAQGRSGSRRDDGVTAATGGPSTRTRTARRRSRASRAPASVPSRCTC